MTADIVTENQCKRPGCTRQRRQKSDYCAICAKWINNQKRKQYTHATCAGIKSAQRGATIYDPLVALPYHMTKCDAEHWLRQGAFERGVVVEFPDRRVTVGE
jgi:hypothetical protein